METKEMLEELKWKLLGFIGDNIKYVICVGITALSIIIAVFMSGQTVKLALAYSELEQHKTHTRSKSMEFAYMEGQIDYMRGDIRVAEEGDDYIFTVSPWDGGTKPHYWKYSKYSDVY